MQVFQRYYDFQNIKKLCLKELALIELKKFVSDVPQNAKKIGKGK